MNYPERVLLFSLFVARVKEVGPAPNKRDRAPHPKKRTNTIRASLNSWFGIFANVFG